MGSLHEFHVGQDGARRDAGSDFADPGPRRVDHRLRRDVLDLLAELEPQLTLGWRDRGREEFRRAAGQGAEGFGRAHHGARQRRIVGLGVPVLEDGLEASGAEPVQSRPVAPRQLAEAGLAAEPGEQRIKAQAGSQIPGSSARFAIDGQ